MATKYIDMRFTEEQVKTLRRAIKTYDNELIIALYAKEHPGPVADRLLRDERSRVLSISVDTGIPDLTDNDFKLIGACIDKALKDAARTKK